MNLNILITVSRAMGTLIEAREDICVVSDSLHEEAGDGSLSSICIKNAYYA